MPLLRASFSSRRTMKGSQNPIISDADAGVVGVLIVVDDRGFIRCGAPAGAALSMLSARPCPGSHCVFIRLTLYSSRDSPYSVRYWVYG